jgi:hypothetical protein
MNPQRKPVLTSLNVMAIHFYVSWERLYGMFYTDLLHTSRGRTHHTCVCFVARSNTAKNQCFAPSAVLLFDPQADPALLSSNRYHQWQCLIGVRTLSGSIHHTAQIPA